MKHLIKLLLPIVFMTFLDTSAQETAKYGVKLGYSRSSMVTKEDRAFDLSKSGFVVGAYSKIPLNGQLYFQPEILFIQKGDFENRDNVFYIPDYFKLDSPVYYVGTVSTTTSSYYLSMPLNLVLKVNDSFGILLGGEPSLNINELTTSEFNGMGQHFDLDREVGIKNFDLGLNFGIQYEIKDVHFELRYTRGVLNVINDELEANHTNSSLQFTLGYTVFQKKRYY